MAKSDKAELSDPLPSMGVTSTTTSVETPKAAPATAAETLEQRMERLEKSLAEQQTINANLATENMQLRNQKATAPKSSLAEIEEYNRREAERIAAATGRVNDAIEQKEKELLEGEKKFTVWINGESRMNKVVGAHSELEARAKFQAYFGITAIADPKKQIQSTPLVAA